MRDTGCNGKYPIAVAKMPLQRVFFAAHLFIQSDKLGYI